MSRRITRNAARAEETPEQASERHVEELRSAAHPPTAPVPVRVNNPQKIRREPVQAAEEGQHAEGIEVPAAVTPGVPVEAPQAQGGQAPGHDSPEQVMDGTEPEGPERAAPAEEVSKDDGAHPETGHNVVDFLDRRRAAERAREDRSRGGVRDRPARGIRRLVPRSRIGRLGAGVLGLVLALVLFCGVVFFSPLLSTDRIVVEGTGIADKDAVAQSLQPLQGTPLPRVTEQRVKDLIGENITIRDVSVEARPPHELVVTLHERVPVATVKEGDQYVLVDQDGTAVGSVPTEEDAKVPLVDGGLQAVQQDSFRDVVEVLQALPQSLLQQMTSAQAKSATEVTLEMKDGSTVLWGTSDRSEYKAQVLGALLKTVGKDGGIGTYDVSSPDHPVTTS